MNSIIAGSKGRKKVSLDIDDLVRLHLRIDRFSELRCKLMQRTACSFKIIKKINDNAYKLELPSSLG